MSTRSSQGSLQLHYSVTKGATRRDTHYISCLNTDADPSKWREPGPAIDNTGVKCYWKTDDPECQAISERWKKTLGKTVAKLLGLTNDDASDEDWRVQDFPKNYKLFRHVKGQRDDYYLFGSEWVGKFRTANEFSPHFHWLCTHEPTKDNRIYCKCKYCSGLKTQGMVNLSLGISDQPKRFSSPIFDQKSSSQNKRKAEEEMTKENLRRRMTSESSTSTKRIPQKPVTARKSFPNNALSSASNGGGSRRSTFSGPYVNKDRDRDLSELKCTFRTAELVWCRLDTPIEGTKEGRPDLRIDYWPAICEERVLVTNSQVSTSDTLIDMASSAGPLSLKVEQKFRWKVRLLAASDVYYKDESQLLAYLNYPPPLNIYQLPINSADLKHLHDGHESDRPTISSFSNFTEALASFALSLQITAHIKKTYTLMDRYDIALLKRPEARGQSLQAEEVQILYEDSSLPWYQYIWWGAEKIWSGELIRLLVTASELPPGLRPITPDNHSRCFFLKITGFYRNTREEGMAKGAIFELSPIAQKMKDESESNPEFDESKLSPGLQHITRYMPEAPGGYFFRRLTPVAKEHHLVLQHIAGRYYPLRHPISLNSSNVEQPDSGTTFSVEGRSFILSGMGEGRWLHMHCETWTLDRKECFKEAEALAEQELMAYCENSAFNAAIKTTSVIVSETETESDEIMRALENGTGVAGINEDAVLEAGSVAAIDRYVANSHTEVDNHLALNQQHKNEVPLDHNNDNKQYSLQGTRGSPRNPPVDVSSVQVDTVPPRRTIDDSTNTGLSSSTPRIINSNVRQVNEVRQTAPNNVTSAPNIVNSTENVRHGLHMDAATSTNAHIASSSAEPDNIVKERDGDVVMEPTSVCNVAQLIVEGRNAERESPRSMSTTDIQTTRSDRHLAFRTEEKDVTEKSKSDDSTTIETEIVSADPRVEEDNAAPLGCTQAESKNSDINLALNGTAPSSTNPPILSVENEKAVPPGRTEYPSNFVQNTNDHTILTANSIDLDVASKEKWETCEPLNDMGFNSNEPLTENSRTDHTSSATSFGPNPQNRCDKEINAEPLGRTGGMQIKDTPVQSALGHVERTIFPINLPVTNSGGKEKSTIPLVQTIPSEGTTMNAESSTSKIGNGDTEKELKTFPLMSTSNDSPLQNRNPDVIDPALRTSLTTTQVQHRQPPT